MTELFYIKTFGCQMNKHDSDSISQILINEGYRQTQSIKDAHIILVNTCAVREKAEEKALSLIGRLSHLRRKKPHLITGVIGCVAQERGVNLLKRFPYLDLILGPRNIYQIDKFLSQIKKERERISSLDLACELTSFPKCNGYFKGRVTSLLKIMEGCDNFCTYCIVPFVRGRETSLPAEKIIYEAKHLVSQGIKEITLIGQNVNSYNVRDKALPTFPGLLNELDSIAGLERLRFTTSHPKNLSDELIDLFAESKSLCPHMHLPVQSGSNNILKLMSRGYTRDRYIDLIERLRKARPGITITSDMIVGFPGETEKDFEDSLRLIDEIGFDNLFSFKYSERPGIKALELPGKIGEKEKQRRLSILQERQRGITLSKNRLFEGTIQEILVEGPAKRGDNQLTGRTRGDKVVNFSSANNLKGRLVMVRIVKGFQNSLLGELVDG
ncbi:MAG: tRNA (N6-isopentenyl adenosine(37)-C2)-methylthiotransferase MiaB [Desulfatiglandales bacterium]